VARGVHASKSIPARIDRLTTMMRALAATTGASDFRRFNGDELTFMREVLGAQLWAGQRAIVERLFEKRFVAVRSSRKGGKTEIGGYIIEAFAQLGPCNVISTAAGGRQVETGLWSRVNRIHANARVKLRGECRSTSLKLGPDWYAIGFSTNDSTRFQGFHAGVEPPEDIDGENDHLEQVTPSKVAEAIERAAHDVSKKSSTKRLLLLFDECFGIDQIIFDAAKGSMIGDSVYVLAMGNPTREANDSHESCRMHADGSRYHRIKIAALRAEDPDPCDEEFVTPRWIAKGEELAAMYQVDDPLYRPMVLGQFASGDLSGAVVTHAMLLAACEPRESNLKRGPHIGFDTAWKGSDLNVAALWVDSVKVSVDEWHGQDTLASWDRLKMLRQHWSGQIGREIPWRNVHIDDAPVAAGIIDKARREGADLDAVNFGGSPTGAWSKLVGEVKLKNRRAELYWVFRELLRTGGLCLPKAYNKSWQELTSHTYRYTDTQNELLIDPKEGVRKKLGRSPDHADADVLAFSEPQRVSVFRV
jgi:hypothetical protein